METKKLKKQVADLKEQIALMEELQALKEKAEELQKKWQPLPPILTQPNWPLCTFGAHVYHYNLLGQYVCRYCSAQMSPQPVWTTGTATTFKFPEGAQSGSTRYGDTLPDGSRWTTSVTNTPSFVGASGKNFEVSGGMCAPSVAPNPSVV